MDLSDLPSDACTHCRPPRLLIVPGLRDSGPLHWQSWLERRQRGSIRPRLDDWNLASLDAWIDAIEVALAREPAGPWIAVAHSYGCLAVLRHLQDRQNRSGASGAAAGIDDGIVAALLVAPASPARHDCAAALSRRIAGVDLLVVASSNDPWLPTHAALPWAQRWGARLHDLGEAGHINAEAGFGPWPFAREQFDRLRQRWMTRRRSAAAATRTPTTGLHAGNAVARAESIVDPAVHAG